jgi:hypothetical protein
MHKNYYCIGNVAHIYIITNYRCRIVNQHAMVVVVVVVVVVVDDDDDDDDDNSSHVRWVPRHNGMARPQVADGGAASTYEE